MQGLLNLSARHGGPERNGRMPILETEADPHYPGNMIERIAKLEQIAADTASAIANLRAEMRPMRTETAAEFRAVGSEIRTQFYWLLGAFGAMFAIMAHGFQWL